jgi:hypothetical protein
MGKNLKIIQVLILQDMALDFIHGIITIKKDLKEIMLKLVP